MRREMAKTEFSNPKELIYVSDLENIHLKKRQTCKIKTPRKDEIDLNEEKKYETSEDNSHEQSDAESKEYEQELKEKLSIDDLITQHTKKNEEQSIVNKLESFFKQEKRNVYYTVL